MQTSTVEKSPSFATAIMSMQRLPNISRRYGNAYADLESDLESDHGSYNGSSQTPEREPDFWITSRRSTDVTDTDSIATSISEDAVTDDGLEQRLDYRSRILRRRAAQARINNTLQYAQDRIDGGIQPVQQLAEDVVRGGDHLYNDVAMPMLDEALFKVQVTGLVIWRLLVRFFWFAARCLIQGISSIPRLLLRCLWLLRDTIDASFEFMLNLIGAAFRFTIDLLRWVFLELPGLIRNIPWHTLQSIAVAIGILTVFVGMLHGFMGTTAYICNDPKLAESWKMPSEVCNVSTLKTVLKFERNVLAELAENSDTIMHGIHNASLTNVPNRGPIRSLLIETTSLSEFARIHSANLSALSKGQDISAMSRAIHGNVTALNRAVDIYGSYHGARKQELEVKAKHVLETARAIEPHSSTERFVFESVARFFPSVFSLTSLAHAAALYADMVTYFVRHMESTAILQHGVEIEHSVYNIRHDLPAVQRAITDYEPFWRLTCENYNKASQTAHDRCHIDPSELLDELQKALGKTEAPLTEFEHIHRLYKLIHNRMSVLRERLNKLLKSSRGEKSRHFHPASARAILHQFVVQVSNLQIYLGYGTYTIYMTLGPGSVQGSRWQQAPDGSYTAIFADPYA